MKVYQLKVSLFGYHQQPINKLHRIITISENHTFADLHDIIFEAFDRFDPHLYSFHLTKQDSQSMQAIMDAPTITNPYSFEDGSFFNRVKPKNAETTTIKQAKLKEKEVIHYWFDFGDDWWHRIRIESITDSKDNQPVLEISKKVGESPEQYPDFDEDWDEHWDEDSGSVDLIEQVMGGMIQQSKAEAGDDPDLRAMVAMMEFMETMSHPDVSLSQERDAYKSLIEVLQQRLKDIEQLITEQSVAQVIGFDAAKKKKNTKKK